MREDVHRNKKFRENAGDAFDAVHPVSISRVRKKLEMRHFLGGPTQRRCMLDLHLMFNGTTITRIAKGCTATMTTRRDELPWNGATIFSLLRSVHAATWVGRSGAQTGIRIKPFACHLSRRLQIKTRYRSKRERGARPV